MADIVTLRPSRDLLDLASTIGEVALTLTFIARGLRRAWEDGDDYYGACAVALRTAQEARRDLDAWIAEMGA